MTDLVTLAQELRAIDLRTGFELALAIRKARRPRRQAAAAKGWETRRRKVVEKCIVANAQAGA